MDYNLVELEFFRLFPHIQSLKQNHYPDKRIYNYQRSLFQLCVKIEKKITQRSFSKSGYEDLLELSNILIFVKTSIECLKDSTLNLIPFEALFCLEAALNDWADENHIENVLVITHQYREYYYESMLSDAGPFFSLFADKYNVVFKQRLILISIPKFELNDYLSNVVLYHELGHFIERKYEIIDKMFAAGFKRLLSPAEIKELNKKKNHYREYFCDLFAAQYIMNCCSMYLNYIAYGYNEDDTHPSTISRIEVVRDFLANSKNVIVEELKAATRQMTKGMPSKTRHLQMRVKPVEKTDFMNLIPCEIRVSNPLSYEKREPEQDEFKKLHYLFVMGWELWLDKNNSFKGYQFSKLKIYEIINNLIEKSISNYIVQRSWDMTKNKKQNVLE